MRDELGGLQGWRAGLAGMIGQVRRRENDWRDLRSVLWNALRSIHGPTLSGMTATVAGRRGGGEYVLVRQCGARRPGAFLDTMATITGLSAAAFDLMILDKAGTKQVGLQPPETWADPERFFALCASLGGRPDEPAVGAVLESRCPP